MDFKDPAYKTYIATRLRKDHPDIPSDATDEEVIDAAHKALYPEASPAEFAKVTNKAYGAEYRAPTLPTQPDEAGAGFVTAQPSSTRVGTSPGNYNVTIGSTLNAGKDYAVGTVEQIAKDIAGIPVGVAQGVQSMIEVGKAIPQSTAELQRNTYQPTNPDVMEHLKSAGELGEKSVENLGRGVALGISTLAAASTGGATEAIPVIGRAALEGATGVGSYQGIRAAADGKDVPQIAEETLKGAALGGAIGGGMGIGGKLVGGMWSLMDKAGKIKESVISESTSPSLPPKTPTSTTSAIEGTPAPETARINHLPFTPELNLVLEKNPEYQKIFEGVGADDVIGNAEVWKKASELPPMTVEELTAKTPYTSVAITDKPRAIAFFIKNMSEWSDALINGNKELADQIWNTQIAPAKAGYDIVAGTFGRGLQQDRFMAWATKQVEIVKEGKRVGLNDDQIQKELNEEGKVLLKEMKITKPDSALKTFFKKFTDLTQMSKFSSLVTLAKKPLSDTLTYGTRAVERTVRGALLLQKDPIAAKAALRYAWGTQQGFINGFRAYIETYRRAHLGSEFIEMGESGEPTLSKDLWENLPKGKKALRAANPLRHLTAVTNAWHEVIKNAEIMTEASELAHSGGGSSDEIAANLEKFGNSILTNLDEKGEIMPEGRLRIEYPNLPKSVGDRLGIEDRAKIVANEYTYQQKADKVLNMVRGIQRFELGGVGIGRMIFPAVKFPYNEIRFALNRSPLGILNPRNLRDLSAGGKAQADALARIGIGTIQVGAMWALFNQLKITGAYPSAHNKQERDYWEANGIQEWSIKIGNHWVKYDALAPTGQLLKLVASVYDSYRDDPFDRDHSINKKTEKMFYEFSHGGVNPAFLEDMGSIIEILQAPTENAAKIRNLVTSNLIPNFLRDVRIQTDPTIRKPNNILEAIENTLGMGLSPKVPAKIDFLGKEKKYEANPLLRASKQSSPITDNPILNELGRLGYSPGMPDPVLSLRNIKEKYDLREHGQELAAYNKDVGQEIEKAFETVMQTDQYEKASDQIKIAMLRRIVENIRVHKAKQWAIASGLAGPEAAERLIQENTPTNPPPSELNHKVEASPDTTSFINNLIKTEGGFVDNPADSGGPTKFGITQQTLSEWRNAPVDTNDVANLTEDEAKQIYQKKFVEDPGFDSIKNEAVRNVVIDAAVNHGIVPAIKLLQETLGVSPSGTLDEETKTAIEKINSRVLIKKLINARLDLYNSLVDKDPSQRQFLGGWITRLANLAGE